MKNFLKTATVACAVLALGTGQTLTALANHLPKDDLVITDEYTVEQIVEQKFGKGDYTYEKLSSFTDPDRFILVEGDSCYLIYDNQLNNFMEYSTENNSPYKDVDMSTKKVYYSPTYYFYKIGDRIFDLYDDSEVDIEDINLYKMSEENLKESILQSKAANASLKRSSSLLTSENNGPKFIKNSFYFENLRYNKGTNTNSVYPNSCSYVALEMFMSYYDTFYNDNVIDEKYDVTEIKSFSDYYSINIKDFLHSPGIDDNFHSFLINYGQTHGYSCFNNKNCISITNMIKVMNELLNPKNLSFTANTSYNSSNTLKLCKDAVDADSPFIVWFQGNGSDGERDHDVVGFGYSGDGIYVNYGWKNSRYNICIYGYTLKQVMYINFESEHSCSNNYHWTVNGITGTICPCGKKVCNHGSKKLYKYDDTYHKLGCLVCGGDYTLINHSYVTEGEYKTCSDCGHRIHTNHRFTYTPIFGGKYHWARCRCGYENREPCMGYASVFDPTVKCNKCGQTVTSEFKMEDENQPSFIIK